MASPEPGSKQVVPVSVTFFPNGMAGVCNASGEQIGKYQGRHAFTVEALATDGYDWKRLPDVLGAPTDMFACANCRRTFPKGWSDKEAKAEFQKKYPGHDISQAERLCDDCQKLFNDWLAKVEESN